MKLGGFWGVSLIEYGKTKTTSWKNVIGAQFINFPINQTNQQGCQMKISMKKTNSAKKKQEKGQTYS